MMQQSQQSATPLIRKLNALARLMDTQFRIPGTKIRFGFDGLIGLIPGVGDLITLAISTYLISSAIKNGASGFVVARMVVNTGIDAIIGAIPVLGDIFDVAFKANMRNMRLLQQHFGEGRHQGSAGKVIIPVVIGLLAMFASLVWLTYKLVMWVF